MGEPEPIRQFRPLSSGRRLEHVVGELQRAIVRGELTPGQKLPAEPELAAQFGVSRTALREALKALELSGYLVVRRGYGGGTFVSHPEAEEFTTVPRPSVSNGSLSTGQLMDIRLAIEPYAARLACSNSFEKRVTLQVAGSASLEDKHPAHVLAAVADFHVAIAEAAGNPVFVAILETLRPLLYRSMNKLVQDPTWRTECSDEHLEIAHLIQAGDGDRAEETMRRHLAEEVPGG